MNAARGALLFELEAATEAGRRLLFESVEQVFGESRVPLKAAWYAEHCLGRVPELGARAAARAAGLAPAAGGRIGDAVRLRVNRALDAAQTGGDCPLREVVRAASGEGLSVGFLSALSPGRARRLLHVAGLPAERCVVMAREGGEGGGWPSAVRAWRELAKRLGVRPERCVAVVTHASACRSALGAGLPCIAVPDAFAHHHDFSGVMDVVADFHELAARCAGSE